MLVSDLILSEPKRWKHKAMDQTFMRDAAKAIKRIQLLQQDIEDEFIWEPRPLGAHSVKSFYLKDQKFRFANSNPNF